MRLAPVRGSEMRVDDGVSCRIVDWHVLVSASASASAVF